MPCLPLNRPDWDREKPLTSNYKRNRFCNDPNTGFGRNAKPDAPQVNDDDDEAAESDDGEPFTQLHPVLPPTIQL